VINGQEYSLHRSEMSIATALSLFSLSENERKRLLILRKLRFGVRTGSGSDRIKKFRSVSEAPPDPVATAPGSDTAVMFIIACAENYKYCVPNGADGASRN